MPASAKEPCAKPVTLPDRALKAREVTRFWGIDRNNLDVCETRRAAAVEAAIEAAP